jgi:hypothetical protein
MSQDRSVVQGGKDERVKAVFYPKDDNASGAPRTNRPAAATCNN